MTILQHRCRYGSTALGHCALCRYGSRELGRQCKYGIDAGKQVWKHWGRFGSTSLVDVRHLCGYGSKTLVHLWKYGIDAGTDGKYGSMEVWHWNRYGCTSFVLLWKYGILVIARGMRLKPSNMPNNKP